MSDYAPLLRRLNHWNWKVRDAALTEAKALPPDALLELAQQEVKQYRRRGKIYDEANKIVFFSIFGSILMIPVMLLLHRSAVVFAQYFCYGGLLVSLTALLLPKQGRRSVAKLLSETNDIRFLGPALEMLARNDDNKELISNMSDLWERLLPQVRADHGLVLSSEQRKAAARLLSQPTDNIAQTLAVLKALEQIGDEQAIPAVEQIISGDVPTTRYFEIEEREKIIQAAADCLPFLKQNAERFRQADTLLRPSSAEVAAAPTELLRPVSHSESTPPEQLLRAANQISTSAE